MKRFVEITVFAVLSANLGAAFCAGHWGVVIIMGFVVSVLIWGYVAGKPNE